MIKVAITGAAGKMGREAIKAINNEKNFQLVAALGNNACIGDDAGTVAGISEIGLKITKDPEEIFSKKPDIILDLTHAGPAYEIITQALNRGISCVSGSTGFSEQQLKDIESLSESSGQAAFIIPNFSIGAILMMKLSVDVAKYFSNVEIIERHHENKKDSPSGTAIKTAELLLKNSAEFNQGLPEALEKIKGSRGGTVGNINIHSMRLPGYVATQEVVFGGLGQTLTIKHETINREAFMPGVVMAIKKASEIKSYVYGLENLI